jgi:predicted transcriptional regulator
MMMMTMLQKRLYQKKKQSVEKFIKRFGKVEHSFILNEVNIDYDTLMKILAELRNEGRIK